jgi:hypothetical protein
MLEQNLHEVLAWNRTRCKGKSCGPLLEKREGVKEQYIPLFRGEERESSY